LHLSGSFLGDHVAIGDPPIKDFRFVAFRKEIGMSLTNLIVNAFASRATRAGLAAIFGLATNGCAALKQMTADFNHKWDNPEAAIAELDESADGIRASSSSSAAMAAINSNDCARQFGLSDPKADKETLSTRQISAGECLLENGRNEDALTLFTSAAQPSLNAVASQGAGIALVRLGRNLDAIPMLEIATALDPTLWRAWNAYGVARDNLGEQDEAWSAFQKAVDLPDSDGVALNNLGVSKLKAGFVEEAVVSFKTAMAHVGARVAAEANLRLALAYEGDYAGAIRALPDDRRAVALNNAGVAATSRGDLEKAKELFARAIEESPSFYAKAYNNLSLLLE